MFNNAIRIFVVILLLPNVALARWQGPKVVLTGTWGNESGQFDIYYGESADYFPQKFFVDKLGNVIIPDDGNKRIAIYDKNGRLKKLLTKPSELPAEDNMYGWPGDIISCEDGNSIVIFCRYEKMSNGVNPYKNCFLDYDGKILAEVPKEYYVVPAQYGYILTTKDRSFHYSPAGKMIEERPAPAEKSNLEDGYGSFPEYRTDNFKKCETKLRSLKIPKSQSKIVRPGGRGFDEERELIAEYGGLFVTSNCDAYVWKRTLQAYSILKWSWFDEQKKH